MATPMGPHDWDYYYGEWGHVPPRTWDIWPSTQPLPEPDLQKLRADGIEFVKRIGRGGFGEVWRTKLTKFRVDQQNKFVPVELACKVTTLKSHFRDRSVRTAVYEVLREIDVLKKLSHPHIIRYEHVVRIFDEKHDFPQPIYALCFMELCHGSLTTLIKFVGRMSEPIANDWLMQVSQALKYLHDSGIAHFDIKPDNILFKEHPQNQDLIQVKLTDFSLSHVFSPDSPPMTERAVGTFYYLAPELRDPEAHDAFKTDIYSLGMTLAESLVGVDKKNPPNFVRLVDTIRKRTPFRSISPLGQDLIRNMTTLDANERFDINQVLAHQWINQVQYIPGNYFSLI